jgi:hypothetical protein
LASYPTLIGLGLLFLSDKTVRLLQSNGEHGNIFPRLVGMPMSGMDMSDFGMFRARVSDRYPATLIMRFYFLVSLAAFLWDEQNPLLALLAASLFH